MGRPIQFTPRERRIRHRIRVHYWRLRNPAKMRLLRRSYYRRDDKQCIAATRRYEAQNPGYKRRRDQKSTAQLSDHYVRRKIFVKCGIRNPTPEQIAAHRRRLQAVRSRRILKLISVCASLTKK